MINKMPVIVFLFFALLWGCNQELIDQKVNLQTMREDLNTLIDRGEMDTTDLKILGIILHTSPEYGEQIERMSFRELIQDIRGIRSEADLAHGDTFSSKEENSSGSNSSPTQLRGQFFRDYDQGMYAARELKKPVVVYFREEPCGKCDLLEKEIWKESDIAQLQENDFILIYLEKDDKTPLADSEQKTLSLQNRDYSLETTGDKWAFVQKWKFGRSFNPFYAVLDFDEEILFLPNHHQIESEFYLNFLTEGKRLFLEKHISGEDPTI